MNWVTKRISDKRVHKLIRAYLNAGALEGGLTSAKSKEGIPQASTAFAATLKLAA
ncbi:MAG: hypothetical protein U0105_22415 [Candidatus Obscuribacterales bacterium]